jgi:predicted PurR-regulated permease PerM
MHDRRRAEAEEFGGKGEDSGRLWLARPPGYPDAIFADRVFQTALRASLAVVLVLGALLLVYLSWGILRPFIVAVVLATMLWTWVTRVAEYPGPRDFRLPRAVAVGLIYLVFLLIAAGAVYSILAALLPWLDRLMALYPQQTAFLRDYLGAFRAGNIAAGAAKVAGEVAQQTAGSGSPPNATAPSASISVGTLALGIFGGLVQIGLVLIFTFFLLLEGDKLAEWALLVLPRERRTGARLLGLRVRARVSRWVVATAIYSAISGGIITLGMWLFGIPSPWFFGAVAGILALIPGVGPASVTLIAVVVALDLAPWQPIAVAAFGIALYILDAAVIAPKIFGDVLRLPMLVVLLSILIGGELLGIWGAILALPVAVMVQIVIREALGLASATAAGDDPA